MVITKEYVMGRDWFKLSTQSWNCSPFVTDRAIVSCVPVPASDERMIPHAAFG